MCDGVLALTCTNIAGDVVAAFDPPDVGAMTLQQLVSHLSKRTGTDPLQLVLSDGRALLDLNSEGTLADLLVNNGSVCATCESIHCTAALPAPSP